jgi:ADP-heptose:LPS heptosyltransferase
MIIKKNFNKIEIILPPLIGDCVMVFNVINGLKKNYYLSLVCNEYTFYIIKYLFNSIEVSLLKPQEKSDQIIIDFLSNELSSEYLKVCKNIFSIGFQDGYFDYDYYLNQPSFYQKDYASSIFNQVFEILNVKTVNNYDFSFDFKWKNHNQQSILIIPGASIIDRCYKIEDFILLADLLDMKITFLLGPMDISLSKYIPSNYDIVKSNSIKDSLKLVSKQKLVVASEGGFMHISAAFGVPLIGLFKIAKKENWFPYKNSNQFAIGDSLNDYSLISKNID